MAYRTVAQSWGLSKWGLAGVLLAPSYPVRALNGARFAEEIRTEAVTRIEANERRRLLARDARFGVTLHGDTLVVSADSVSLGEVADGRSRAIDTDGFVGGRYRLTLDSTGLATLWQRPFVPDELAEVSDVGRAMDDFFPPLPPRIVPLGEATDRAGRHWRRLGDSSGVQRFRWSHRSSGDGAQVVADTVPALVQEATREESALAWTVARGPLAWTRQIESNVTTRLRGRTIRASVVQRIVVSRTR